MYVTFMYVVVEVGSGCLAMGSVMWVGMFAWLVCVAGVVCVWLVCERVCVLLGSACGGGVCVWCGKCV
jgi:hypothetical protein